MATAIRPFGDLLREWRLRRRKSQLGLACEAEISTRHLSFLETGRSQPSREMVLRLAEQLDVPLRARNALLASAGFAPIFAERAFDDPAFGPFREAVDLVLKGHEPYPALAIDRHWTLLAANAAVLRLVAGANPALLASPANALRLSLHPQGLAPRIANLAEWRGHLLARLRRQIDATADPALASLLQELRTYPTPGPSGDDPGGMDHPPGAVIVPLRLAAGGRVLNLFSTTTVFGTPLDVTLAELALECFYPADSATAAALVADGETMPA